MRRHWGGWLAVVVMASFALATPAHAALFLIFETKSFTPTGYVVAHTGGIGAPGDLVRARTAGRGAMGSTDVMPVFLAAGGVPQGIESVEDLENADDTTRVGELRSDSHKTGRLEFEVPELAGGDYELIAYCPECARYSGGRDVVPLAPFRVLEGAKAPAAAGGTSGRPPYSWILSALLLCLVVGAAAWLWGRRSRLTNQS